MFSSFPFRVSHHQWLHKITSSDHCITDSYALLRRVVTMERHDRAPGSDGKRALAILMAFSNSGGDIRNVCDAQGWTPLHFACYLSAFPTASECLDLLCELPALPNEVDVQKLPFQPLACQVARNVDDSPSLGE